MVIAFYILASTVVRVGVVIHPYHHLVLSVMADHLIAILICIVLIPNATEHLFMCFVANRYLIL